MSLISAEEVETIAARTYDLLNGVVNPNSVSKNIYQDDDMDAAACRGVYKDGTQNVFINIQEMISFIDSYEPSVKTREMENAIVVHSIIHELMHCNQLNINALAYDTFSSYNAWIEGEANARALRFMVNYCNWIEGKIGFGLDLTPLIKYEEDRGLFVLIDEVENVKNPICITSNGPIQVF